MTILSGALFAIALLAQTPAERGIAGIVVDDQGKPVATARVIYQTSIPWGSKAKPIDGRATTDVAGQFRIALPSLPGGYIGRRLWAFRAGLALAAEPILEGTPQNMVLHKPAPKTIKIEGPDGRTLAGARVAPRVISFRERGSMAAAVPNSLAESLAVTTGPDGSATLVYLAPGQQLEAVRVTTASIGTQDIPLNDGVRREGQGEAITIRLKPTSHLVGRVKSRAGEPVAGQMVEVWSKGGNWPLESHPVGFMNGPICTATDGSFDTPDNLLVGSQYRVVVRAPGMEPILSEWLTIDEKPRVVLPLLQRPLRTISWTCRRPTGQAGRRNRSIPVGRWPGTNERHDRRRRPVLTRRVLPRAGVPVRAWWWFPLFWTRDQARRSRHHTRADSRERAAGPGDDDARRSDSARGITRPGAAVA